MHPLKQLMGRGGPASLLAFLVAGSAVMAAAPAASSQDGSLRGRVLSASGRAIAGAAVVLKPGNTSVVTDREGFFTAHQLPAGTYTVEVNYVGMDKFTKTIQVQTGLSTLLNVQLREIVGMVIEVTDSRVSGEVEALNKEKNSMEIVNVLPAEIIRSLPNSNVADAIGRLPSVSLERDEGEGKYVQVRGLEPRFTSVSVNGVRIPSAESGVRQIKLDGFPSDLLGAIELHKTVSADLEGDAIGGAINLMTKNAPDGGMSTIGYEGGYNSQSGGRHNIQMDGTFAQRYLPNNALGVVFGMSYDRNERSIEDVEPNPTIVNVTSGGTATVFNKINMQEYLYDRKRLGAAGGLDYRLDDNSNLYLKGYYSKFQNFGDKWVTTVATGKVWLTPTTTDASGKYTGTVGNRRPTEETYSFNAGGKHDLGSVILDYNLSVSHASQIVSGQIQASYNGPSKVAFQGDFSNGDYPQLYPLGGVTYQDPSKWTVSKFSTKDESSETKAMSFETNALFPYEGGLLKVGLKYRNEDKDSSTNDHSYSATGSTVFTLNQGLMPFTEPSFYGSHYQLGPLGSMYAIQSFFNANPAAFKNDPIADKTGNDPNIWDAKEKVTAAYVKNTSQFATSQLEYGVRFEKTSTDFTANKITYDSTGAYVSTVPITGAKDYSNLLPSASWRYEFDKDTILRVVYGWAIGRPDYSQLVPSLTVNQDAASPQLSSGNPDLKPTKGVNYDVLFEKFLPSVGVLSVGVFYKDLTDPIYAGSTSKVVGGIYDGYTLNKPINGPKANISGFEVAWKQHLSFLPGAWAGLGIDTNYTHTTSKATFVPSTGRTGTASLQRTAPDVANFGVTYDRGGFSFRIAATYNSAMIFAYNYADGADGGLSGPNGDTYLFPHTQIDAQASYTLKNGLKVQLSCLNLSNEVFGFYNGSPQWNIQREFYNRTFTLGVKKTW